jgi:hypothetical protein
LDEHLRNEEAGDPTPSVPKESNSPKDVKQQNRVKSIEEWEAILGYPIRS